MGKVAHVRTRSSSSSSSFSFTLRVWTPTADEVPLRQRASAPFLLSFTLPGVNAFLRQSPAA